MKKTKILAVLGIILAMGMTACGSSESGKSNGGDTPSQQSGDSSEHKHAYGEWTQTKAPTCTEKGEEQQVCECGDVKTRSINALGHDWGEWAVKTAATCTQDGVEERVCKREGCGQKEERAVKAAHQFGAETDVIKTGTSDIDYKTAFCSVDNAIKISFPTEVGGVYAGTTRKSNTPTGYTKLNGNGSISWTLNLAGTKGYIGKMYHMACMDAYTSNSEKTYGYYTTSSSSTRADGNFKFYVNGIEADKSAYMSLTFEDLTKDGENDPALDEITSSPGPYSKVALCPLGDNVYVGPGENVFKYERTGSYNMVMRELVFIGTEYNHEHNNAADVWESDETQHWNACTNPGCPTDGKVNAANHTFGDKYDEVAATCSAKGSYKQKCSVCGYVKTVETDMIAHTYGDPYDVVAATCEAAGSQKRKCSVCDDVITEVLPKLAHTFGDVVEQYAAGEGYIATSGYNCSVCDKGALRWSALDYDTTLSSSDLDKQSTYVRFASGSVENSGGTESVGSHIIYNINVSAAVEKAGLSFKIKNTGGSGWGANAVAPVFNKISGDSADGFSKQGDEFVNTGKRYGLKVNDVEYFLGDDSYGNQASVTAWFDWPVEFPLKAGVNKIDIFAYAGYRAQLMEFQLTGLPKIVSSHTHNGDATWLSDDSNHWHVCTGEGCPIEDGIYDKAAHDWNDVVVTTAATHAAAGAGHKTCKVCGYTVDVVIPQVAHEWVEGTASNNTDGFAVTPLSCDCGKVGAKMAVDSFTGNTKTDSEYKHASNTTVTYKIIAPKAGNYQLKIGAYVANNRTKDLSVAPYTVKLGEGDAAVDVAVSSGTYEELGIGTTSAKQFVLCPTITLAAGENVIALSQGGGGYRLTFKGLVEIIEL